MKNKKMTTEQFAITVSAYTDYKERSSEIVADVLASTPLLSTLNWSTGHKAGTTFEDNIFETSVTWSNGACVKTETGNNTSMKPRPVSIVQITDREITCIDLLSPKIPMFLPTGANMQELNSTLSSAIIDGKVDANANEMEVAFFQGDTTIVGATNNLGKVNGVLKIADGETSALAFYDTITDADMSVTNIEATLRNALANRTPKMLKNQNVTMWLSYADYAVLQAALLAKYGIAGTGVYVNTGNQNETGEMETLFIGTNVKVRGTYGLDGNGSVWITDTDNNRGYTDLEHDLESIDIFFDKPSRSLYSDLIFAVAFNYMRPEDVIYLKRVIS